MGWSEWKSSRLSHKKFGETGGTEKLLAEKADKMGSKKELVGGLLELGGPVGKGGYRKLSENICRYKTGFIIFLNTKIPFNSFNFTIEELTQLFLKNRPFLEHRILPRFHLFKKFFLSIKKNRAYLGYLEEEAEE